MGIAAGTITNTTKVTIVDVSAAKWSKEIDKLLELEKRKMQKIVKLLLLGAGESGKSTIVKQMRIIHNIAFSDCERMAYKLIIHSNIIQSVRAIVCAMKLLGIEFHDLGREKDAKFCLDHASLIDCGAAELTTEMALAISRMWQDRGFFNCFNRSSEYQLNDSAAYFFDAIFRVSDSEYIPTDHDIVRARLKTTGVVETRFQYKGTPFRLVDVGGQRTERRKWIHCFDDVTAVLFIVALSEYNLTLREDNITNRIEESKVLFNSVCNSAWFRSRPVIIFLNKTDIFAEKIKRIPLTVCFPEYKGLHDQYESRDFICKQFLKLNGNKKRQLYHHYTNATDKRNVEFVFDASMDVIMKGNLQTIGMM
ncbi:Guanine nucleotide-binding protein G(i) subunit alpha [Holothuria leucospilota]|uniref:Guanine nucleotide-binding protein G(I) subunit alpha n=1 Tax=Holothuria leucospilota TaxID=206669 RepID=A0A9Q1HBU1_HOLLE|nr:Guanine nucleotide-binding protein G(i) subunit alpha [Holothuria leucospilota]